MRSSKDPRHIARIVAVMELYNFFFDKDSKIDFDSNDFELGKYSEKLAETIFEGVKDKYEEIDEIIDKYSTLIKTNDLDNLILQILRIGVFEAFMAKSVPPKVAVDEAIELARDFGQELSVKKVSGILGKIFDNLAKEENLSKKK